MDDKQTGWQSVCFSGAGRKPIHEQVREHLRRQPVSTFTVVQIDKDYLEILYWVEK